MKCAALALTLLCFAALILAKDDMKIEDARTESWYCVDYPAAVPTEGPCMLFCEVRLRNGNFGRYCC